MEDPRQRREQESIRRTPAVQRMAQEQQLRERLGVEQRRGHGGRRQQLGGLVAPLVHHERPVDVEAGEPLLGLAVRRRIEDGAGQQRRERIEVHAHADASAQDRLEGHRAATAERVQDHVTRPAEPLDERVRHGRRQAAKIGAQGVEGVPERARLVLPVRGQRQPGQIVGITVDERERQLGMFWHGVADGSTSRDARQAGRGPCHRPAM